MYNLAMLVDHQDFQLLQNQQNKLLHQLQSLQSSLQQPNLSWLFCSFFFVLNLLLALEYRNLLNLSVSDIYIILGLLWADYNLRDYSLRPEERNIFPVWNPCSLLPLLYKS